MKTHWEMTYELQFDERLTSSYYSDPTPPVGSFIGKRFIKPKFFQGATYISLLFNSASVGTGFN